MILLGIHELGVSNCFFFGFLKEAPYQSDLRAVGIALEYKKGSK